ncbi:hypothetical protein [Aliikangiella sp. IMCC44359]|uniref:hypothetical protein n=1 Tax=Aliikangiella sp. IMCC44359 TaxID=3459125 RepID=UPI00403AD511
MEIRRELKVIGYLAALPALLAFLFGGAELLTTVIKALTANKWIMYYSMFAAALFVFLAFIKWRFIFGSKKLEQKIIETVCDLKESAASFLGILRVSAGLLITIPIIWLVADFNAEQLPQMGYLFFVGLIAVVECVYLRKWLKHIDVNWLRTENS